SEDSDNSPAGTSQNSKVSSKNSSAVQIPTKNGKKNGKAKNGRGGGILEAVASKKASEQSTKTPTPPSSVQSPEMQPTALPGNGNINSAVSPLLGATSVPTAPLSAAQATSEWARAIPSFSSSPNNLISLGESPPILPSSYDDRASTSGWAARDQRGFNHGHPQSASPPTRSRRPLSYQLDGACHLNSEEHHSMPPYGVRRGSLYAQYPQNL
ncbi:hypothetical protein DH86_00000667, partial [Scytalidium sp. 3C]